MEDVTPRIYEAKLPPRCLSLRVLPILILSFVSVTCSGRTDLIDDGEDGVDEHQVALLQR